MMLKNWLLPLVVALPLFVGCDSNAEEPGADESVGEEIDEAGEDTGDALDEAGDDMEEAVDEAG